MKPLPSSLAAALLLVTLLSLPTASHAQNATPQPHARVDSRVSWWQPPITGMPGRLLIQTQSSSRAPLDATVTVRFGQEILGVGQTGPDGFLILEMMVPDAPPWSEDEDAARQREKFEESLFPIDIVPSDTGIQAEQTGIGFFDLDRPIPNVVLDRTGVRAGERLEGEVRTTRAEQQIELGVVLGGKVLHRMSTRTAAHRATFAFPLPPDAAGIGTVTVLAGEETEYARFVVIEPAAVGPWPAAPDQAPDIANTVRLGPQRVGPWHIQVNPLHSSPASAPALGDEGLWLDDDEVQENLAVWLHLQPARDEAQWRSPLPSRLASRPPAPPAAVDAIARTLHGLPGPDPGPDFDDLLPILLCGLAALLVGLTAWRDPSMDGLARWLAVITSALALFLTPLLARLGPGARPPTVQIEGDDSLETTPRRYPDLPATDRVASHPWILEGRDDLAPDTGTLVRIERDGIWLGDELVEPLQGGAIPTPPLDLKSGLCGRFFVRSRTIGVHPAMTITADPATPYETIQQVHSGCSWASFWRKRLVRKSDWVAVAPPVFGPATSPWWFLGALVLILGALAASKARWPSWCAASAVTGFGAWMAAERLWPVMTALLAPFPLELGATRLVPWLLGAIALAALYEALAARRAPSAGVAALAALAAVLMVPLTRDHRLYAAPAAEAVLASFLACCRPHAQPKAANVELEGHTGGPLRLLVIAEASDGRVVAGVTQVDGLGPHRVQAPEARACIEIGKPAVCVGPRSLTQAATVVRWLPWHERRPLGPIPHPVVPPLPKAPVPRVTPSPVVTGALDKELIRRVYRKNRRDIRQCYEAELARDGSLAGEVVVRFTIDSTGSVITSTTQRSTMNNAAIELCVNETVRQWLFPKPRDGNVVIVEYPFVFEPR